jgi:hypothetical protein
VVHDAAHLAQKTDHQRFRCLGPRTPVLQAAAQGVEALSPVIALGGDQLGRLVVGNGRGIPCGGMATMWPIFRRIVAIHREGRTDSGPVCEYLAGRAPWPQGPHSQCRREDQYSSPPPLPSGLPPGPDRPARIEYEYERGGALQYLAAWDVHRGYVMGRCEPTTGISKTTCSCPFHLLRGGSIT